MKNIQHIAVWMLLGGPLLLASCDKNDKGQLEGPAPTATFTVSAPKTVGLNSQVTFTSTATDAAFYEWDFGDGTRGTGQTVAHTYKSGGTVKAVLYTSGKGGTGISAPADVVLPQVSETVKQYLTGGSSKTWMLDNSVDSTIVVGPSDKDPYSYYHEGKAGSLPACQADDEYTFTTANVYSYDAKAQTFVAGSTGGCMAPRSTTSDYTFGPAVGTGYAMFEFKNAGTFIGVTDVPDLTYRIVNIDDKHMRLRAGKASGSLVFEMRLVAK